MRAGAIEEKTTVDELGPATPRVPERGSFLTRVPTLPQLLRGMGALVLVAAALTFMLSSWETADDIGRYFQFLFFTGSLAAAGLLCGTRLGDDRGARTFLALAAATVAVHFTYLGALIYSQLGAAGSYPDYARIVAPDPTWAFATTAVGATLLAPITAFAFLVLARPRVRSLTLAYMIGNAFLLLPSRDPNVIAPLALLLGAATIVFDRRCLHGVTALGTFEGGFVRLLMLAPPATLFIRSFNLYEVSNLLVAALMAWIAVLLFEAAPLYVRGRRAAFVQHLATAPALLAWALAADTLLAPFSSSGQWTLPVLALPSAAILGVMSVRCVSDGRAYRRAAGLVAAGAMTANLFLYPGTLTSFLCVLVAIAVTAYGHTLRERTVFAAGILALLTGVFHHVIFSVGAWGSLAILGAAAVFAATLAERRGAAIRERWGWLVRRPQMATNDATVQ